MMMMQSQGSLFGIVVMDPFWRDMASNSITSDMSFPMAKSPLCCVDEKSLRELVGSIDSNILRNHSGRPCSIFMFHPKQDQTSFTHWTLNQSRWATMLDE